MYIILLYNYIINLLFNDIIGLTNITEVLNLVKTNFKIINKKSNNKLIMSDRIQKGGKNKEIKIDKTTYSYDIKYGEAIDIKYSNYEVQFVIINDYKTKCAVNK